MSFLGGLKKIGKKVGHLAEKAAPFVGLIPGVGTLAAGAIGGLGGLAAGDGLKGALKYGALGAAGGLAGGAIKGAMKGGSVLGGLKKVGGSLLGGKDGHIGLGDIGHLGGSILGGVKKLGVDNVLGGASLGYGAYQMKKAGDLRNKALKLTEDDFKTREPLRKMGLAGLLNEQRPDLSQTFQPAQNNPFAVRRVG